MDFGVPTTKVGDVCLVALLVEPAEHRVELFAQNEAHDGQRKLAKFNWLAHHLAENLRGLEIRQLAAGNLQFEAEEVFGTIKSQSHKGSDIVRSDGLIRLVGADGVGQ